MPPTDKILLQEFAVTRSPSAFDQIAVRHGGMVYASILRTVRNRNLAEEATQAVFLVLAQKAGTLAPHTPLASWLLKAARYAAIDLLRKESRHARHERRASAQRPEAVDPLPEEDPRLAAMEEALLSLTTADREALLLRYHHNEPFAQIAISLDTTLEAVRNYSLHQKMGNEVRRSRHHRDNPRNRGGRALPTGKPLKMTTAASFSKPRALRTMAQCCKPRAIAYPSFCYLSHLPPFTYPSPK